MVRTNVSECNDDAVTVAATTAPTITLAQALDVVDRELARFRPRTEGTVEAYRKARCSFCSWAESHGVQAIDQITLSAMTEYVTSMQAAGYSSSTIATYARYIRRLVISAASSGRVPAIDEGLIKWMPHHDRKTGCARQALTADEVERVRAVALGRGLRALAVVQLSLCGLRSTEVAAMTVGDVDGAADRVRIYGKGREDATWVDVPPTTSAILQAYIETQLKGATATDSLWSARTPDWVERLLRAIIKDAGITRTGVCPASFRNTAAAWLLRKGWPMDKVSEYLRYNEPRTVMRFADVTTRETADCLSGLVAADSEGAHD